MLAYDFGACGKAVDFFGPEAYGRIGDWERVKEGRFTVSYAHLCDPNKPLVWAEAGLSVWDAPTHSAARRSPEIPGRLLQRLLQNDARVRQRRLFWWWYPGGYRTNERSDFGIINPDGTDRPVTKVIRDECRKFLSTPKPATPDTWIEIDRDNDARGLHGIYQAVKGYYWSAIKEASGRD